jgi:hypothetical protein
MQTHKSIGVCFWELQKQKHVKERKLSANACQRLRYLPKLMVINTSTMFDNSLYHGNTELYGILVLLFIVMMYRTSSGPQLL